MCCPAPFFFLMFWGQIGVKIGFSQKMSCFIQRRNDNKKARSLDKIPKLRAFLFLSVILKITVPAKERLF